MTRHQAQTEDISFQSKPAVPYSGTKAAIEALASPTEGMEAYATDTNEKGFYNGSDWIWTNGGGGIPETGSVLVYNNNTEMWENHPTFAISSHYTGFPDRVATSIGWDDGTYTFTLTATADPIWINGISYTINTLTKALSVAQEAVTGMYWFWVTAPLGVTQLNCDVSAPGFDKCLVATVYWNTSTNKGIVSDERHWMGRDRWMHEYLHETIGARYAQGMAGTFTDTTISIGAGEFYDEDIEHKWVDPITTVRVMYHSGTSAWAWDVLTTPYKVINPGVNNTLYFNNVNSLTAVDNNKYVNYWVYATGDVDYPIQVFLGTAQYVTLALARAAMPPSLGTLLTAENKLIYKITYQNEGGTPDYKESTDYRTASSMPTGNYVATDHGTLTGLTDLDHPASAINNTPAGNIAATTVQAAIDELDTEKLASVTTDGSLTGDGTTASPLSTSNLTSTVTSSSTTTLTASSTNVQLFTGTLGQTVVLPVVSTLVLGRTFEIINATSSQVAVLSSGGTNFELLEAGQSCLMTCIALTGVDDTPWNQRFCLSTDEASALVSGNLTYLHNHEGQLTSTQKTDLTDGGETVLHTHPWKDGWIEVTDEWTYASANTINIPSNGTLTYKKGMCIRFKQGGSYKYFNARVIASTLITVFIQVDYTVANAGITDIAYSFIPDPYGFPESFAIATPTWTTTGTAFTNQPGFNTFKTSIKGNKIDVVGTAITNAVSGGTGNFIATWAAGIVPAPNVYGSTGGGIGLSAGSYGFCFVYIGGDAVRMSKYDGAALAANSQQFGFSISYLW